MKLPSLEEIAKMGRKVPWGDLLRAAVEANALPGMTPEIMERMKSGAGQEILEQLRVWSSHLTRNALLRWPAAVLAHRACYDCEALGLVHCEACGRSACLEHSLMSYDATGVCDECASKVTGRRRAPPPRPRPAPRSDAELREKRRQLAAAWKKLGIEPGASFDEVKRRYRKLVLDHNADRPQSERERARNTERLKQLNLAFQVLKAHFEHQEAA